MTNRGPARQCVLFTFQLWPEAKVRTMPGLPHIATTVGWKGILAGLCLINVEQAHSGARETARPNVCYISTIPYASWTPHLPLSSQLAPSLLRTRPSSPGYTTSSTSLPNRGRVEEPKIKSRCLSRLQPTDLSQRISRPC